VLWSVCAHTPREAVEGSRATWRKLNQSHTTFILSLLREGTEKWPSLYRGRSPGRSYSGKLNENLKGDRGTEVS
jgi:predicted neuraminidase